MNNQNEARVSFEVNDKWHIIRYSSALPMYTLSELISLQYPMGNETGIE